jgi:hypothetical protein
MRSIAVYGLCLLLWPGLTRGWAQEPATDLPVVASADVLGSVGAGSRLRIVVEGEPRPLRARLIDWSGAAMRVQPDARVPDGVPPAVLSVPWASIERVEVEERDSLLEGAVLGALYFAACARWWCNQGTSASSLSPGRRTLAGAGLGVAIGAAIDASLFRRRTIFARLRE